MDLLITSILIAFGSASLTWFLASQAHQSDRLKLELHLEQKVQRARRRCELLQGRLERTQLEARNEVLKELARFLLDHHTDPLSGTPLALRDFERRLLQSGRPS
ncbi:MAG: hypothetical protein KJZ84_07315 [Bryobacteraceae bacterium]|nr:hypothetical protein [Bryobacteraceae bacterium]